jgi:hypothetical protein
MTTLLRIYELKWNSVPFTGHLVLFGYQIKKFTTGLTCSWEEENKSECRILIWKSVGKATAFDFHARDMEMKLRKL